MIIIAGLTESWFPSRSWGTRKDSDMTPHPNHQEKKPIPLLASLQRWEAP
jgi:hypothetical protein